MGSVDKKSVVANDKFNCGSCNTQYNGSQWITHRMEWNVWMNRNNEQKQMITNADTCDKVFLGDSITQGWYIPRDKTDKKNLNERLFRKLFGKDSYVYAISGDKINDLGWRLMQDNGLQLISKCQFNYMIINIGTNNFGAGMDLINSWKEYSLLLNQLKNEYKTKSHGNIVLIALLPRYHKWLPCDEGMNSKTFVKWNRKDNQYYEMFNEFNLRMRHFASNNSDIFSFCDCASYVLNDVYYTNGYINGKIAKDTMNDFLHFTIKGYQRYGACILDHITFLQKNNHEK